MKQLVGMDRFISTALNYFRLNASFTFTVHLTHLCCFFEDSGCTFTILRRSNCVNLRRLVEKLLYCGKQLKNLYRCWQGRRSPESRKMMGGIAPLPFQKGGNGNGGAFSITVSWVISWFIKIDLKQIYCSYSRNKNIQNGYL